MRMREAIPSQQGANDKAHDRINVNGEDTWSYSFQLVTRVWLSEFVKGVVINLVRHCPDYFSFFFSICAAHKKSTVFKLNFNLPFYLAFLTCIRLGFQPENLKSIQPERTCDVK